MGHLPGKSSGGHAAWDPLDWSDSEGSHGKNPAVVDPANIDINSWSILQLLQFRLRIDAAVPAQSLKDVDLAHELVIQMQALKQLQGETMSDRTVQLNQRAQVANSLSAVLAQLSKYQNDVYDSERVKRLESILIDFIRALPDDSARKFLDVYEERLGGIK